MSRTSESALVNGKRALLQTVALAVADIAATGHRGFGRTFRQRSVARYAIVALDPKLTTEFVGSKRDSSMTTIFVSYASARSAEAEAIKATLKSAKHEGIFVAHEDIEVGQAWREKLMYRLRSARAVVLLWSKESAESMWCHSEIAIARFQNKPILTVRLDDTPLGPIADLQAVRFGEGRDAADELCLELERLGLGSASSFPAVEGNPYPGFQAFEKAQAAVYFGRDDEIQDVIARLARSRGTGAHRMTMITGPSGAGKSSLLRAGIIPRLEKNPSQWRIIGPIRTGVDTLKEIARAFAVEFERLAHQRSADTIFAALTRYDSIVEVARDLCSLAGTPDASVVLCIDQLEDLFQTSKANVAATLDMLATLDSGPSFALIVAGTVRTDALAQLYAAPRFAEQPPPVFTLGLMPESRFADIVQRPAEHVGIAFEPALVTRLIEDVRIPESLPLVAIALRAMFADRGTATTLRIAPHYQAIGGVKGVVASLVASIMKDATPTQVASLREAFLKMVTLNDEGRFIRRRVPRAEIPVHAHHLVEQFTDQRLLMTDGTTIEVTHESLFEVWPALKVWLAEERDFLIWQKSLRDYRRVVEA